MLNVLHIAASYILSTLSHREIYRGVPIFLSVEPTSLCNLRCPECPSGTGELNRSGGFMTFDRFKTIIDPVRNDALGLLLYFQGEPFLNRDIYSMIAYARQAGLYVIISTNGHFFSKEEDARRLIESGLNSLIVSLDGVTQETYQRYRVGGSLEKVLKGVENILAARNAACARLPRVYFQFVVMSHNEHEIPEAKALAERFGADKIFFKKVQIVHDDNACLLPERSGFRRYEIRNDRLALKGAAPNRCLRLWTGSVVSWDGKHLPCCYDKTASYSYGAIDGDTPISRLLHSEAARRLRQNVLDCRSSIPLCADCPEGRGGALAIIKKFFTAQ